MKFFALLIISLFVSLTLAVPASALTRLNIYLDETGQAVFLGETDQTNLILPAGILVSEGKINGKTSELTTKNGLLWTFTYTLTNSELNVILPEGAVIKSLEAGEISLYREQIAIFNKNKIRVSYTIEEIEEDNSVRDGTIFILLGVALVVITIYLTKRQHRKNDKIKKEGKKKVDKIKILSQVLNDRERLIVGKLKEVGKIKMSYLRKACDIPKASFSRHIRELEKKKLVKFSGEGKNKFVQLGR